MLKQIILCLIILLIPCGVPNPIPYQIFLPAHIKCRHKQEEFEPTILRSLKSKIEELKTFLRDVNYINIDGDLNVNAIRRQWKTYFDDQYYKLLDLCLVQKWSPIETAMHLVDCIQLISITAGKRFSD